MADQLGSAVLTLSVDDRQFNAGLQKAQTSVQQVGATLQSALGTLGLATSAAGIAAFVGNQVTQLDAASAAVRTLGVDSKELGSRLQALSAELNNNISTLDLTKAAYDVASSGFSSAAAATEILRASALGAKGGFAEVNDVASALTGVLNAYGLSASEATNIVDGFVQTQADGVITVRQYAAEIGNIASIAAASGVGIQELNAAIATATLRGVPVAQTFTGLRQALSSIIKPSEQAKDLAQSLGIQFNVGALQAKGLGGVLADVQQKTGGAADKIAILLGSVEAQAAVQPLLNDKLVKYNELLDKQAQSSGAAAEAAQTNAETISGGLTQIGNGFSNLATTLDSVLSPLLGGFIKQINDVLAKLNQVSALSPDKVLKREREATDAVASQIAPGQGSGFFGAVTVKYKGKTYKGSAAGIREAIIQDLLKQDLAKLNAPEGGAAGASSASTNDPARASRNASASATNDAAKASSNALSEEGNRLTQEALDKQTRLNELKKTEGQIFAENIAAANQLRSIQEEIAIQQQRGSLTGTGLGALGAVKAFNDAKRAEQDAQAALRANPGSSDLLKASNLASENVRLAAAKTKADLQDAFKSAQDSVQSISQSLQDAVLAQQKLVGTNQGLTGILGGQAAVNRQKEVNAQLQQQARDVKGEFINSLGPNADPAVVNAINRKEFAGSLGDQNRQLIQFIEAARQEIRGGQGIGNLQEQLVKAQNDLVTVNSKLAEVNEQVTQAVTKLVEKNWTVNVNVPGGSASGDVVGAINSRP